MTIEVTRNFLLWCTVINYGVLLVWFLVFVFAHDWILRIHGRWFRLSRDQFDAVHYAGMSLYKIGIISRYPAASGRARVMPNNKDSKRRRILI